MEKNNLIKVIKAEHQQVMQEFSVLLRGLGAKQSMLSSLLSLISDHFSKEEKFLFAKLEKHSRMSGEATSALVQDHAALLKQLQALNELDTSHAQWSASVAEMAEALHEHFRYEEDTYFKYVRAAYSKTELEAMVGEKPEEVTAPQVKVKDKAEKKPAVKKVVKKAPAKKPAPKKETVKKAEKKPAEKKSTAKSVTKKTTTKTKTTPNK